MTSSDVIVVCVWCI